jgi:hypothetical protein
VHAARSVLPWDAGCQVYSVIDTNCLALFVICIELEKGTLERSFELRFHVLTAESMKMIASYDIHPQGDHRRDDRCSKHL